MHARGAGPAIAIALSVATGIAVLLSRGHPLLSAAPVLAGAIAWSFWRAPLRFSAMALLGAVLLGDAAGAIDVGTTGATWVYPLEPLGRALFEKLDKLTGVDALKFNLVDVLVVVLALSALERRLTRREASAAPVPSGLVLVELAALAGILAAEAYGLLSGGDFKASLYQIRQLLYVPILALVLQGSIRCPRDHALIAWTVVGAAAIKAAIAIYAWAAVFRPAGFEPKFITSHSDSVLFVVALVALAAMLLLRRPGPRTFLVIGAASALILAGLVVNDRRLAYIELVAALAACFALHPTTGWKRSASRGALLATPLLLVYLVVGWGSDAAPFAPVRTFRGVIDGNVDASTLSRERENFNLVFTLKQHPVLGSGFGHPYLQLARADDLSFVFPQWHFIPHNSLLGLLAFAGSAVFTLVWLPLVAALFLAVRTYRSAIAPAHRVASATAIGVVIAFVLQSWGDMGLQSTSASFLLAVALASAGTLSVEAGAWPARWTPRGAAAA